jgi:hypothetical protein
VAGVTPLPALCCAGFAPFAWLPLAYPLLCWLRASLSDEGGVRVPAPLGNDMAVNALASVAVDGCVFNVGSMLSLNAAQAWLGIAAARTESRLRWRRSREKFKVARAREALKEAPVR